jgi:enoyl-CoA hydratase/carnithine racemase
MTATPKFETVRYEPKGPICHIVLNRPEKLNAANDQLVEEVNDALFEFDADPELQVAILSGAGRAFCSGADVRQRQLRTRDELKRLGGPAGRRSRENGLGETVNWKPVIAAVHGWALGLGYSLSQSCDLVVAAQGAKFQIREVQRGLASGQHWVATWFWTGSRFANEVALTGRMFTAEEALQHGMVNRVVPAEELIPAAEALAAEILANPPVVREREAAPVPLLLTGTGAAPQRGLPGVGPRLRGEAQAPFQGPVAATPRTARPASAERRRAPPSRESRRSARRPRCAPRRPRPGCRARP